LLLSSSIPSPLMAALPFVFLTNELHVLPSAILQSGQHPTGIQITKLFFQSHIEDIRQEFSNVQAMGSATAEEWVKGLDDRGKERRNDAVRWERWEVSGGVGRMRNLEPREAPKLAIQVSSVTPAATPSNYTNLPSAVNGHIPVFQSHKSVQPPTQFPQGQVPHPAQPIQSSYREYPCAIPQILEETQLLGLKLTIETSSNDPTNTLRITLTKWVCSLSPSLISTSKA